MGFRLRMVTIAVAVAAAGWAGGGTGRGIAATAAAVATNPADPLRGHEAGPEDEQPPGLVIHGKVVDIETGQPITDFVLQRGSPDPETPGLKSRERYGSPNPEGSLHYTYTEEGEWWRVLAAGYVPQPITEKPYDGRPGKVNVTVRLRRGWRIAGRVLDSSRKPVAGASVFLVGGRMTLPHITGGKAWRRPTSMRREDKTVTKALTDGDGRFVLNGVGGYETAIAVSTPVLDLWIHEPVPALGKSCEILLPRPGKLVLRYGIEGGEPEATVSLSWQHDERNLATNRRELKVPNGGRIVLDHLMPGMYRVERKKTVRVADESRSLLLETWSTLVEAGKMGEVALVRETGTTVEGEIIGLDKGNLPGALIYIVKPGSLEFIEAAQQVNEAVEALTCDATGRFKTPRLPPGAYEIVAEGYAPPKPGQFLNPGRFAAYHAFGKLTVPERGTAPRIRIEMHPREILRLD